MNANITTPSSQRKPSIGFRIGFGTLLTAALLCCALPAQAVNYAGNGDTSFGGPIGNGTLTLTDDGTTISGTLTTSAASMNDVLVIFIQTGAGGSFADTSGFLDNGDGSRAAISGYGGTGKQSVMTFVSDFRPNFAIALGPNDNSYGGLWQLANGGANSMPWITSVNLNPVGTGTGPFTFSFPAADIGLTPGVNATIKIFGTYVSNSGYRSAEAVAGDDTGTTGWNPFTQTAYASYTFDAGAPVTYPVTFSVDMSVQIASGAFNPSSDTVYAAGTFQASPWSGFQLSPTVENTNIYTGTAQDANPLGTPEQYKFEYHSAANGTNVFEGVDNRPFTLATSQSLPLVYFDDVAPAPGTNYLTFQVDMTPQLALGHFDPAVDVVEVRGTFQTPDKWVGGFTLTNDPNGANTNLYSGTYGDGNYPGSWENYKFVYTNSVTGDATFESINNRDFFTPAGPTNFALAYFNNVSATYTNPVTFQVDMTVPILAGQFNPGNGDSVGVAGSFQEPTNWVVGSGGFLLTPSGGNPNIYIGTYIDQHAPGTFEQYKFVINTNELAGGGTAYETINNRSFDLASGGQTLPVVFWDNNDANNVALTPTMVTFTVNMTNAVDSYGNPFDPNNDDVLVNGDWVPWWSWTTALPDHALPQYIMANNPLGSLMYSVTLTIPAGNPLQLTYKYGIWHNTSAANTNMDNEAGFAQNHVRFIRNAGSYTLPPDIFGIQRTNAAAATEISFGNLAIGAPAGGHVPVSWLGRPGVYLQTAANIAGGPWQTYPETTNLLGPTTYGLSSTNWPMSGNALFFRLVNP